MTGRKYRIRTSRPEDRTAVVQAHSRSIREVCHRDYTTEQIEKWSDVKYDADRFRSCVENDFHRVVEVDGEIRGFCHGKLGSDGRGEIVGLYLTPEAIGLGAGKALVEEAFDHFRTAGVSTVFLTGTRTARGFYEAMGFVLKEEWEITLRGTVLPAFLMEREI